MEEKNKKLTRTFICIEFPDEVVKEIARIQRLIEKNVKFTGKMTELENLHLTLKFLGEIDDEKLEEVKKKLSEIKFSEMNLKLGEIGTFSYNGNPRIIWIKVDGKEIWDLQKEIDKKLNGIFASEERFMSHLTIARIKYVKDKKGFSEYIRGIGIKEIKFKADRFKLMASDLKKSKLGPVYSVIEEYKAS